MNLILCLPTRGPYWKFFGKTPYIDINNISLIVHHYLSFFPDQKIIAIELNSWFVHAIDKNLGDTIALTKLILLVNALVDDPENLSSDVREMIIKTTTTRVKIPMNRAIDIVKKFSTNLEWSDLIKNGNKTYLRYIYEINPFRLEYFRSNFGDGWCDATRRFVDYLIKLNSK
jgi:hypothetical protein